MRLLPLQLPPGMHLYQSIFEPPGRADISCKRPARLYKSRAVSSHSSFGRAQALLRSAFLLPRRIFPRPMAGSRCPTQRGCRRVAERCALRRRAPNPQGSPTPHCFGIGPLAGASRHPAAFGASACESCAAPCVSAFDSARSLPLRVPARKSSRRRRDPTHSLALRVPARDLALRVPARSLRAACLFCPPIMIASRSLAQASWVRVLSDEDGGPAAHIQ